MSGVRIPPPRPTLSGDATRKGLTFGSVRQTLCLRFLMVAVAHQVEHRIVAPEVAGSRPVSHPTFWHMTTCGVINLCRVSPSMHIGCNDGRGSVLGEFGKKKVAIHAPVRCVSVSGLLAFRGHLKCPCRVTRRFNVVKRHKKQATCKCRFRVTTCDCKFIYFNRLKIIY